MPFVGRRRYANLCCPFAVFTGHRNVVGRTTAVASEWCPSEASAQESAQLTIANLEAQGFDVKINRIGSAPLNQCVVTDIRNARNRTELVRRGDDLIEVVAERNITVTADCSRR